MKKLYVYTVTMAEGKTSASVARSIPVISWIKKPGTIRGFGVNALEYDSEAVACNTSLNGGEIVGFDGLYYSVVRLMTGMGGLTRLFLKQDKNPDVA